jgi:hypothetical protein
MCALLYYHDYVLLHSPAHGTRRFTRRQLQTAIAAEVTTVL